MAACRSIVPYSILFHKPWKGKMDLMLMWFCGKLQPRTTRCRVAWIFLKSCPMPWYKKGKGNFFSRPWCNGCDGCGGQTHLEPRHGVLWSPSDMAEPRQPKDTTLPLLRLPAGTIIMHVFMGLESRVWSMLFKYIGLCARCKTCLAHVRIYK